MSVDNVYIEPEELGSTLKEMISEYGVETRAKIDEVTREVSKDTRDEVKEHANIDSWGRFPERKGKYKKSISYRMYSDSYSDTGIIYARGHEYSLTHLLENGHRLWNAPARKTRAFPHWKKGQDLAEKEYVRKMKQKLSK